MWHTEELNIGKLIHLFWNFFASSYHAKLVLFELITPTEVVRSTSEHSGLCVLLVGRIVYFHFWWCVFISFSNSQGIGEAFSCTSGGNYSKKLDGDEPDGYESPGESGPPSARDILTEESTWGIQKFRKVQSARMYNVGARLKASELKMKKFPTKCTDASTNMRLT